MESFSCAETIPERKIEAQQGNKTNLRLIKTDKF
jgi:hypothetical protein